MDGASPSHRGAGEGPRPGSSLSRQEQEYFNDRAENTAYVIACSVGLITTYDREKCYSAAALVEKSLTSYLKSRYLELNVPMTMAELDTTFSEEAPIYKLLQKKQNPTVTELRNEPMATSSPRKGGIHESKVISQHLARPELDNSEKFFTLPAKKAPIKMPKKRNAEERNTLEKFPGPSPPLTQNEPVLIESDTDNETMDGPRQKKRKPDKRKKSDHKGTQKSASPNRTPTATGKTNSAPPSQVQEVPVRQEAAPSEVQLINEALTSDEEDAQAK